MRQRTRLAAIALSILWLAALLLGGRNSLFDPAILSALHAGGSPVLVAAAIALTQLGGWIVLIPVSLSGSILLLVKRRSREAFLLLAIVMGGRVLVDLQKLWLARARPVDEHLVTVHSLSFPSAHAANAVMTYLTLAMLLSGRRAVIATALLLAFLIGMSRILLGVHWPSDVVGGWAFGLLWTLALIRLARSGQRTASDFDGSLTHPR